MKMVMSPKVRAKLANKSPPVSRVEVEQCFASRDRGFLEDDREQNRTVPPTWWFISDTFMGRLLKVVFILLEDGTIVIKSAYEPNEEEIRIYYKFSEELKP